MKKLKIKKLFMKEFQPIPQSEIANLAKKGELGLYLTKTAEGLTPPSHEPITISNIHLVEKKLGLNLPFQTSFGRFAELVRFFPIITFKTVDGQEITGVGEAPPLPYPWYDGESDGLTRVTLNEYLIPRIRANSQREITSILDFREMSGINGIVRNYMAKCGVEGAYWDALGKLVGRPVYRLWSNEEKYSVEAGTSVGSFNLEDALRRVKTAVETGISRVKVKIKPGFDVMLVAAIREKYPDLKLQVDANAAYDLYNPDHVSALQALDQFNLLMIEQPLANDDRYYHYQLSEQLNTPICLDESIENVRHAIEAIEMWARAGILNRLIINIKPPRVGGFWEAVKIAKVCEAVGVPTWCGGMIESAVGKTANIHFSTLTTLPGDHVSQGKPYFQEDVGETPRYHNGVIDIPQEPGWGLKKVNILKS